MALRRYSSKDIENLLRAIDRHLKKPYDIVIIGGAAAALAYRAVQHTIDIDTTGPIDDIQAAYKKAKEETGLDIPLGPAGVFDGPYNYEERRKELKDLHFTKLRVFVPEVHDLILMKTIRGNEHDLEQIKEIRRNVSIDLNILVERFRNEMKHVIGNPKIIRLNFLAVIAEVFGEEKAAQLERKV